MTADLAFQPDVFHGELTANRAQVFVRLPRTPENADCQLTGYVHGPRCEYAHTLPARFALQDLGPGPTLLARATITDPCLWTGDLPQIYDVHIELRRGSEIRAKESRLLGLRGLGVRPTSAGYRFVREGKIWVPRGVGIDAIAELDWQGLRDQLLVAVCNGIPPLDLLREASLRGVYLLVKLPEFGRNIEVTLQQLARWPAVMMAVVSQTEAVNLPLGNVAPNLLLGQRFSADEAPLATLAEWSQAVLVNVPNDSRGLVEMTRTRNIPRALMIEGTFPESNPLRRSNCDDLQRAAAMYGQFAAYLTAEL